MQRRKRGAKRNHYGRASKEHAQFKEIMMKWYIDSQEKHRTVRLAKLNKKKAN